MVKWKNRLRRGTMVQVPRLECQVMYGIRSSSKYDGTDQAVKSYMLSIKHPELKQAFWVLIPTELVKEKPSAYNVKQTQS